MRGDHFHWPVSRLVWGFKRGHIGYRIHDFFNARVGGFFIKLYCSIISGMWSILLLLPLESRLSFVFGSESILSYNSSSYFAFLFLCTVLFAASSAVLPRVRQFHLKRILKHSVSHLPLMPYQRVEFFRGRQSNSACKSFFTKEGILVFFKYSVAKNIEYTSLYFALENLISAFSKPDAFGDVYVFGSFMLIYGLSYAASGFLDKIVKRLQDSCKAGIEHPYTHEIIFKSVSQMLKLDGVDASQTQNLRDSVKNIVEMIEINLAFQDMKTKCDDAQMQMGAEFSKKNVARRIA